MIKIYNFLRYQGCRNDVYEYPAEDEIELRKYVDELVKSDSRYKHVDVYDVMINYLIDKQLIDKISKMEKKKGLNFVGRAVSNSLCLNDEDMTNKFVEVVQNSFSDKNDVVLVTGIGKCHAVLSDETICKHVRYSLKDWQICVIFVPIFNESDAVVNAI